MRASRGRVGAIVLAIMAGAPVSGCATGGPDDWRPTAPITSMDVQEFSQRYTSVLNNVASATQDEGLSWDPGTTGPTLVTKLGICSWTISRSGTWAGDRDDLRDLRNDLNRALVKDGFRAARWNDQANGGTPMLVSQDKGGALLEITLGHPALLAIYSPATASSTCPTA